MSKNAKSCLHTDCMRTADKKCNGYCKKCYQIPDKVCNRCEVLSKPKVNWLKIVTPILLFLCFVTIAHGIYRSFVAENILALAGWMSALLWFGAYFVMKKMSDYSLAIATVSLQTTREILEEVELTPEQVDRLAKKLNITTEDKNERKNNTVKKS